MPPEYIYHPNPKDILPRKIVFNYSAKHLAFALLPWLKKNPYFSYLCAFEVVGLTGVDLWRQKKLVEKVDLVLAMLGCELQRDEDGIQVFFFPDKVRIDHNKPTRVGRIGLTENELEPDPQPFQVEVVRAWLKEHARACRKVNKFSSDGLRVLVTNWTKETGRYKDVEQENERTGVRYKSEEVYISNGAFIQGCLDEGYSCKQHGTSARALVYLSYHKTGEKWRGRTPAPTAGPTSNARIGKIAKDTLITVEDIKEKLLPFLDRVKERAEFRKANGAVMGDAEPHFLLKQAARAAGLKISSQGAPPKVLSQALRDLGCASACVKIKGKRHMRWHRLKDMPPWYFAPPKRVRVRRKKNVDKTGNV